MDKTYKEKRLQMLVKRFFDVIVSFLMLVFLVPFILVISILVIADSAGPAIFKQMRPGLNKKMFAILKFRTMKKDSEKLGLNMEEKNPQITNIGKFLRRWHLDEIPQLINVLRGEMSFVGPRPPLLSQVDTENEFEKRRFLMKPGLAGWAQINGGNWISWRERVKYDVWYVDNFNLFLDLKILILSFWRIIIKGEGLYKTEGKG
jgi:lipopolysaccharide/colanic/teichoic acid biosynthesis glycosyltransferase